MKVQLKIDGIKITLEGDIQVLNDIELEDNTYPEIVIPQLEIENDKAIIHLINTGYFHSERSVKEVADEISTSTKEANDALKEIHAMGGLKKKSRMGRITYFKDE